MIINYEDYIRELATDELKIAKLISKLSKEVEGFDKYSYDEQRNLILASIYTLREAIQLNEMLFCASLPKGVMKDAKEQLFNNKRN